MAEIIALNSRKPPVKACDIDFQVGCVSTIAANLINQIGQYLACTGLTPQDTKVRLAHAQACQDMATTMEGIGRMLRHE